ncbi:MAG: hypothetical protein K0B15_10125 [Lentimicrobium sp.]|nr:hypothetical protein [Lentimicrobium sp.]
MKRIPLFLILIFFLPFVFQSCETDFDVTAPWQDITVVYGLISQNDSVHYIKINKAFLGEGNALEYAQNPDSSSYGNNLEVTLKETGNGSVLRTFNFDTTTIFNKEPGIFYAPGQVVYKSAFLIPSDYSSRELTYQLEIRNKSNGKIITATTPLVNNFAVETPRPGQPVINFATEGSIQRIKWTSAKNGKRYNVSIRFWFDEVIGAARDTVPRFIDWNLNSIKSNSVQGGEAMELQYTPASFFSICKNMIPYKDGSSVAESAVISRLVNRVEFLFAVSGDELNTYMEVNEPSSGIVQEKPDYTNIENGIGLFSCRFTRTTETPQVKMRLSPLTEERLITENIKFVKKIGN